MAIVLMPLVATAIPKILDINSQKKNKQHLSNLDKYPFRVILVSLIILISSLVIYYGEYYGPIKSSPLYNSALLYLGVPIIISLTSLFISKTSKYLVSKTILIISLLLLLSALILQEGFVCVAMAAPIFYLVGIFSAISIKKAKQKNKLYSSGLILLILLSFEGVSNKTTFNRYNEVSYTKTIPLSIAKIKHNLSNSIEFDNKPSGLLKLFPMPVKINAGSLNEGDIHTVDYVYNKWITSNPTYGSMQITLEEVSDFRVKTSIEDESYLSSYIELHGTEINFLPISDNQTKITLTIKFDRLLDPYWYFEPIERFALKKKAKFLIEEIMEKNA
jgi:hypothetical protein